MDKKFNTLRGFSSGAEQEEETYFAYSAMLRIFGNIPNLEQISETLSLKPTHSHRKGERRSESAPIYEHDMWAYRVSLAEAQPLHEHIDALWLALKPHKRYLLELKRSLTVDVFLGYRTNCDTAGIEVPHTSLEMFSELEIPFGLSVIVT